jgi:predicted PurR-regulated permease PerM
MRQNTSFFTPYQRHAFIWIALALVYCGVLWLLRPVLTPFLLGAMFAYILQPGVALLTRHRVPRTLAALLMMLLLALVVALLGVLLFIVIETEGPQLRQQVPVLFANLHNWVQPQLERFGAGNMLDFTHLRDMVMNAMQDSTQQIALAAWKSVRASSSVMIALASDVVLVPLVLFYLLYDWQRIIMRLQAAVPRRWLNRTLSMAGEMDRMLAQYLRGQMLVMVVLAAYYSIALSIARFNIALPIGIFTGMAVLIPYLGYATGLVLALVAALLQFGNGYGVCAVAAVYGIGQILEGFFLTPRLVGERIGLHPLAVIFALLAFGQLFGFFGVLLALPASAVLAIALRELRRSYLQSDLYRN